MPENNIPLIPFGHTPDSKELLSWNLMETSDPPYNYAKLIATRGLAVVPFVRISESQNANKLKTCFYSESYLKKWLQHLQNVHIIPMKELKAPKLSPVVFI